MPYRFAYQISLETNLLQQSFKSVIPLPGIKIVPIEVKFPYEDDHCDGKAAGVSVKLS